MALDKKILAKAQRFCVYRERCISEVKAKLNLLHVSEQMINEYIEDLQEDKFVDEKRFATAYANDKFKLNYWGKIKIRQHLKVYNIDVLLINNALKSIDELVYRKLIKKLIVKYKSKTNGLPELQKKQKIINYMYGKGFETDLVLEILTETEI